ncbi:MAG: PIG-L family deacetylase [Deltaproteobacteria bacterium]|nr:PIG-L family deacetylase [Deltaproteobacteria bacterium]
MEPGDGRVVLVVTAHADDLALFLGGTVAAWVDAGWRVVAVRATDDRWDSLGLSEEETVAANASEFRLAGEILGVAELVELGYPTDTLADVSEVALREKIIREIRRFRPYAVVTFDPRSLYGEDNQDHVAVARATDEACWASQFDKHHPEHIAEGLAVHGVFERWYFAREVERATHIVDIGAQLGRKVAAAVAHRTMMLNVLNQLRLQAQTGGWRIDAVDAALGAGEPGPLVAELVGSLSAEVGRRHGLEAAEEFRVVRFGGLEGILEALGTRLP